MIHERARSGGKEQMPMKDAPSSWMSPGVVLAVAVGLCVGIAAVVSRGFNAPARRAPAPASRAAGSASHIAPMRPLLPDLSSRTVGDAMADASNDLAVEDVPAMPAVDSPAAGPRRGADVRPPPPPE